MSKFKLIFLIGIILMGIFNSGTVIFCEKRSKALSLIDLKDESSPSFVPIPYPKNKKELLIDIKYAIKRFICPGPDRISVAVDNRKDRHKPLTDWAEGKSTSRFKNILKVKNLKSSYAEDFYWLAVMVDNNNQIIARVKIKANGLLASFSSSRLVELSSIYTENPDELIINKLSTVLERSFEKGNIKAIEPIELASPIGPSLAPAFQVLLKDGREYYYSPALDRSFKVKYTIPWEKNEKGHRSSPLERVDRSELSLSAFDEINDVIIIFEELGTR